MISYMVEVDGDIRRYKDSETTLVVWSTAACRDKVAKWAAAGQLEEKVLEVAACLGKQPDEMHVEHAYHCYARLTAEYEKFMKAKHPASPVVPNLFNT